MAKEINAVVGFLSENGEPGSGVIIGAPSLQAVQERIEDELGGAVFFIEEVSDEEVEEMRKMDEQRKGGD